MRITGIIVFVEFLINPVIDDVTVAPIPLNNHFIWFPRDGEVTTRWNVIKNNPRIWVNLQFLNAKFKKFLPASSRITLISLI